MKVRGDIKLKKIRVFHLISYEYLRCVRSSEQLSIETISLVTPGQCNSVNHSIQL